MSSATDNLPKDRAATDLRGSHQCLQSISSTTVIVPEPARTGYVCECSCHFIKIDQPFRRTFEANHGLTALAHNVKNTFEYRHG
mmetsp:Transcript_75671/g.202547  ORF Transcript_75671/g.202547 Transcript_75671/m.202547 type:complete len:84 (+) Transcript_75671:178-429(+)